VLATTQHVHGFRDDHFAVQAHPLALKCYANRAACYKQLSNFEGTIADSTMVLEHKPDDIKVRSETVYNIAILLMMPLQFPFLQSLMRRAQASEASERYKSALQDVRQVLSFGQDACGKATYDLANGMQHRLNRVIAQLKNS
jgi:stress-induced-phosphoprotein 1